MPPPVIERQQPLRHRAGVQYRAGIAVAHDPVADRYLGGLAFLEGSMHAGAFEREKTEADCIAKEQAVDRLGHQGAEPDITQRARRRPARPGAEIAAADDNVAGRDLVDPAGPVRGEDRARLLRLARSQERPRQHQVGVNIVAEFPDTPRPHRALLVLWRQEERSLIGSSARRKPGPRRAVAADQVPTRPSCGLDGSAKSRSGIRPARRARRPASTAARIAAAMRRGSCDLAIAVLTSTASQPSSIACAASDAVPMPASSTTGTGLRAQISSMAVGLAMPRPEPISDPSGMTAAQPTSASFWQATGSSLQ